MGISFADHYDAEVSRHYRRLRAATGIRPGDRVLDVGCGAGQTTRDAARDAEPGSVLGVDVSEAMLVRARRLTARAGLRNVEYELGDAQVHLFRPGRFDLLLSRFGTMFFADPLAAFRNLAGAARPGARLVMTVWQSYERNEWATEVRRALTGGTAGPPPPRAGTDPFSLAEPSTVEAVLGAAGFADVELTDVQEPVYYGPDVGVAHELVCSLRSTSDYLAELDRDGAERARERLHAMLATRETTDGVFFDSHAWIVTARRAG